MADAVLLLAFGGPERPQDVRPFLVGVLRGRAAPPERIDDVARHYDAIGGRSPLAALTRAQASRLELALAQSGSPLPVYVGMRNWAPWLGDTVARMTDDGIRHAVAVILSPHATVASRERYLEALEAARAPLGARAPTFVHAPAWFGHPLFVAAVAARVEEALATLPAERRARAYLVFTAHSVPTAMATSSPYTAELTASARAVAERLGRTRWQLAYQSRSGNPGDSWLEPDVCDALRALAADGVADAVVVPVGFVCDHVEVLYDLDVEARAAAAAAAIGFARAATVNDHPLFIRMLAELVREAAL